jgi:hypothetical protein
MEGKEILVDAWTVSFKWWNPMQVTERFSMRLSTLNRLRLIPAPELGGTVVELHARMFEQGIGVSASAGMTSMLVPYEFEEALNCLQKYLRAKVVQSAGMEIYTPEPVVRLSHGAPVPMVGAVTHPSPETQMLPPTRADPVGEEGLAAVPNAPVDSYSPASMPEPGPRATEPAEHRAAPLPVTQPVSHGGVPTSGDEVVDGWELAEGSGYPPRSVRAAPTHTTPEVAPRAPEATPRPPKRAREPQRTLRVQARLAPEDDSGWLSLQPLSGTLALLESESPMPVAEPAIDGSTRAGVP